MKLYESRAALVLFVVLVVLMGSCGLWIHQMNTEMGQRPVTAGPSPTRGPTRTPVPPTVETAEMRVQAAFARTFPRRTVERLIVNERVVTIRFPLSDLSAGVALMEGRTGFVLLSCALRAAGFVTQTYQITGTVQLVDAYGNVSTGEGVAMILGPAAYNAMNCDNPGGVDLARIAERYAVNPALDV